MHRITVDGCALQPAAALTTGLIPRGQRHFGDAVGQVVAGVRRVLQLGRLQHDLVVAAAIEPVAAGARARRDRGLLAAVVAGDEPWGPSSCPLPTRPASW